MTTLVIFDLDGTLLDTLKDLQTCTNHILKQHGYPEHPMEDYKYFVGNGIPKLISRALPDSVKPEKEQQVLKDFLAYYELHKEDYTQPYPGIVSLLEYLQDHQIAIGVASNKIQSAIDPLMETYFPQIQFQAALGSREGVPNKPHPQIVEDILSVSPHDKKNVIYLGDTSVDMQTAKNAGLTAVGALWGFRTREELEQSGADHIIETPEQLIALL
ncbi:MAG TPA: HAD family hydrolase [Bacteroidales bacterium]|nr:HAD family hydrolase [Bacteroidales bacterium]HOH22482.1 HAD family hydrolase [Bacteroidales bacterium]HPB57441.1 HAD family hydrolase [Bacteroidales bacterium]HPZ03138.1 HAD family hydrolase [Bacteroidales bacterium]HQB75740.1 HAD family hydrolase [Bacteroidales bacterium]